jgi:hypothetical protein
MAIAARIRNGTGGEIDSPGFFLPAIGGFAHPQNGEIAMARYAPDI